MISKELFIKGVKSYEKVNKVSDKLYDIKIDIINSDLFEGSAVLFRCFLESNFNTDACDLIEDFFLSNEPISITVDNKETVIHDIDDLYDFVVNNYEQIN